jgi:hypothetical protein
MEPRTFDRTSFRWVCLPLLLMAIACGKGTPTSPSPVAVNSSGTATNSGTIDTSSSTAGASGSADCHSEITSLGQNYFNQLGGQTTLTVASSAPNCTWHFYTPAWIQLNPASGTGSATVIVSVSPSDQARSYSIAGGSGSLPIYQTPNATTCFVMIQLSRGSFDESGGQTTALVTTFGTGCAWKVSAPDWIHVSQVSGTGDATLFLQIDPSDRTRIGLVGIALWTPNGSGSWTSQYVRQVSSIVLPLRIESANCGSVQAGGPTKIWACFVTLSAGQNPTSTSMKVIADLRAIGGRETSGMLAEMGTDGLGFSTDLSVPATVAPGPKTIPFTATDGQGRTALGSAILTVLPPA